MRCADSPAACRDQRTNHRPRSTGTACHRTRSGCRDCHRQLDGVSSPHGADCRRHGLVGPRQQSQRHIHRRRTRRVPAHRRGQFSCAWGIRTASRSASIRRSARRSPARCPGRLLRRSRRRPTRSRWPCWRRLVSSMRCTGVPPMWFGSAGNTTTPSWSMTCSAWSRRS